MRCRTEGTATEALGIVHQLGKPVAYGYSEHFTDYLASSKPNGYRALHTAIRYRPATEAATDGGLPVEFRILTQRMHLTNENGIFHDREIFKRGRRRRHQEGPGKSGFWWDRKVPLVPSASVWRHRTSAARWKQGRSTSSLPRARSGCCPLEAPPWTSPTRSTANSAITPRKIEVNGETAEYKKRLHNGDLVEVHYDPNFRGPIGLEGVCRHGTGRRRIQQGEVRKQEPHTPGGPDRTPAAALRRYEQHRHFEFHLSSGRLDALLLKAAGGRGHPTLSDLYEAIAGQPVRAADLVAGDLVAELLTAELLSHLRTPAGQLLDSPPTAIRLCAACRPVPSDRFAVGLRHYRRNANHLTVHRRDQAFCLRNAAPDRRVPLFWVEEASSKEEMILKVEGEDRHGFLDEVIRVVDNRPGVTIRKVEAATRETSGADVSLLLEADARRQLRGPPRGFGEPPGDTASLLPPSFAGPAPPCPPRAGPGDEPVHLRLQAGPLDVLRPPGTPGGFDDLGGNRRAAPVGRCCWDPAAWARPAWRTTSPTSSCVPLRLDCAVYVNFQGLSSFDTLSLVDYLRDRVVADLGLVRLPAGQARTPVERLSESLGLLAANLPAGQRLLIMLDEINFLLDLPEDRFNPTAVDSLCRLITSRPEVCWLLITQPLTGTEAAPPPAWTDCWSSFRG